MHSPTWLCLPPPPPPPPPPLPCAADEFDKAAETEALADDLLARVTQQADAEYLAALTGDLDLGDKEVVVASSEVRWLRLREGWWVGGGGCGR